jgi:UDP-2,3-diacylglucosamine pyrophosphatase LpxH
MRTLILSDLHLGSRNCHAPEVLDVLDRESYDRLILNGDTLNSINLRKLQVEHWHVIDRLRHLARSRELILVRGNHDYALPAPARRNGNGHANGNGHGVGGNGQGFGPYGVLPALLGVPMVEEYRLDIGGRPYLVLHGDCFDPTLHYPLVSEMADWCYQLSQKISKKLAKWLKKKSKRWGGVLEWVRCQSAAYARKQGYTGVVTGHTHYADDTQVGDVHYVNSGCWTEPPCTYVTAEAGRLQLHQLPN